MNITHEALEFFYRIFFSCYTTGKMSSEHNLGIFKRQLELGKDVDFASVQKQLMGWEQRGGGITEVATSLGKRVIDREVMVDYFGGSVHTQVILSDLAKDQIEPKNPFSYYMAFLHLLIPVVIETIDHAKKVADVMYRNEEIRIHLRNVLYFDCDESRMSIGKTVLAHFPLVIDADPSSKTVDRLLKKQLRDAYFMEACNFFGQTGLDYARYYHFKMLQKRIA